MKKTLMVLSLTLLIAVAGCSMPGKSAVQKDENGMWSQASAWDWYNDQPWMVGFNYLPSTACNQLEMWQADTFDPETIDRELGWASEIGFNTVRVFLHDMMWEQDSKGFVKRIDRFLAIADKYDIKVMPVLFDSCWNPLPVLGKQADPKPYVHNPSWVQSPHRDTLVDTAGWGKLEGYVKGIVKRYKNDDRIVIWDIYNEPGNKNIPAYEKVETQLKEERSLQLMKEAFVWVRAMNPKQPLMASVWTGDWTKGADIPALNKFALENSDIVQFHVYHGPEIARQWIKTLQEYGRPIVCGEYMARTVGSTFEGILPIFKEHRIAAINWGFIAGRSQTNYPWESWTKEFTAEPQVWFHDVIRADGTPFSADEVAFIKNITK
jgi:hypothetical protein